MNLAMIALALLQEIGRREFMLTSPQAIVGAVATLLTVLCVVFHYEVMSWSSRLMRHMRMRRRPRIVALMFAMLFAHVVEVWIFGLAYWWLDRWPEFGHLKGALDEGALDFIYFSVTAFTTIGFGDIVPIGAIRILVGAEALVGLGMITWSASLAFLEMQRDWGEFRHPKL